MESMSDPRREQVLVMGRFKIKLGAVLESIREDHHLSDGDVHDLTHAFMLAAGTGIEDMVRIQRGRQSIIDTVRQGLSEGEGMIAIDGDEITIADRILGIHGISLEQMRAFYAQQERSIISRGLEAQAAGSTEHPIIQGVLSHLYPPRRGV